MGCGRVGSSLARQLGRAGHSVAVIDQDPAAFRRLGREFPGQQVTGVGLRPGRAAGRPDQRGARVRRGVLRRQLQHHRRPGGPRAVRRGDAWSPASTTPSGPQVYERLGIPTVATVPLDHRPAAADDHPGGADQRVARPVRHGDHRQPALPPALDRPAAGANWRRRSAVHAAFVDAGSARGLLPTADTVRAGRRPDLRHRCCPGDIHDVADAGRLRIVASPVEGARDADRHRRRRLRRPVDRRGAGRERPPGHADRPRPRGDQAGPDRGRRVGAGRRLRGRACSRRPACRPATW